MPLFFDFYFTDRIETSTMIYSNLAWGLHGGVDVKWSGNLLGLDLHCSVADPDPGFGAFLTPGSGIRNRFFPDLGSRIPDPKPIFLRSW